MGILGARKLSCTADNTLIKHLHHEITSCVILDRIYECFPSINVFKKIETYSFEINDNTLCDIVLLNDKEYLIDLIYTFPEGRLSGHEEVNHTILSYGNYNTQNNVVTFKDAVSDIGLVQCEKNRLSKS